MKRGISTNRNVSGNVDCLKAAGIDFVFRYYSQTTHQPEKRLTQGEAEALSASGIQIGVVYEDGPTSLSYFSTTRGHQDGVNAYHAAAQLHQPPESAIYFAVDYDAALADIAGAISDYFQGVNQGMSDAAAGNNSYQIGIYGSGAACDFLKTHSPFVQYSWLAESTGWLGSKHYAAWDVNQAIATTDLCSFSTDGYEENVALDDFGGFVLGYASPLATNQLRELRSGRRIRSAPQVDGLSCDHHLFVRNLSINELALDATASAAAHILLETIPDVIFTSGRRDVRQQAEAMAANVLRKRAWIAETYSAGPERDALQGWVDSHQTAVTKDAIATGLASIMTTWSDVQKRRLSLHFSGQAFDIQPVAGIAGERIKTAIAGLPHLRSFLESEGGLVIWHADFKDTLT
jgi:Domain of unknown function (DUF1906)